MTQANAAHSEGAASASEQLSAQAGKLNNMVDLLAEIIGGSKALDGTPQDQIVDEDTSRTFHDLTVKGNVQEPTSEQDQ